MRIAVVSAVALALATLATPAAAASRRPTETIRYETTACFGFCPAYAVTVTSDGRGEFDGHGHTAVTGKRAFAVTPAQFTAFRRRLASVRPNGEVLIDPGTPLCGTMATDQIGVDVRWTGGKGDQRHLSLYFGCDRDKHHDLQRALRDAPAALPIAAFIGAR